MLHIVQCIYFIVLFITKQTHHEYHSLLLTLALTMLWHCSSSSVAHLVKFLQIIQVDSASSSQPSELHVVVY